jgi:hypothetical protein
MPSVAEVEEVSGIGWKVAASGLGIVCGVVIVVAGLAMT